MASRRKLESIGDYCYDKKEILGHGAFAIVFKGYKKQTPAVPVAVKCIAKKELSKSKELLAKEIRVLRELSVYQHENVVALLDVKETDSSVFLMIEFCNGGDLADYLQSKGTLSEDTLSSFMQQIASALNALNDKGIVHRDMKPQNILICYPKGGSKLSTPPTELQLKIADFGFARFLEEGKMAGTLCGSPMYMAPEVIMSHKYDSKADLWSVGTIIFQCLTGKAPFVASTPQQLRAFYEKNVDLKPKIPENTSPELKNMLLCLLTRDATKRISIKDLMHHPFLKKFKRTSTKRSSSSSPSPIPSRRRTPSVSSEGSTPGSAREMSPLAKKLAVDPDKDMVKTLTEEDAGFTKVENPDPRPMTPEGFVLVPKELPEYPKTGEKKGKSVRAPLAEEEYDVVDESVHSSVKPVKLNTEVGKATFSKEDEPPPTPPLPKQQQQQQQQERQPPPQPRPTPPLRPSPSSTPSPPPSQRSAGSAPIPVPSLSRTSSLSQQLQREGVGGKAGSPGRIKKRSASTGSGSVEEQRPVEKGKQEKVLAAPDITQVSPPAVQFSIGTPPKTGSWKRTSSLSSSPTVTQLEGATAVAVTVGSPIPRSASCSSGTCCNSHPHLSSTPPPLSAVPCSPTRHCPHPLHYRQPSAPDPCTLQDSKCHRHSATADCTAVVAAGAAYRDGKELDPCYHRYSTEPDLRTQAFHSHHILRTAYTAHQTPGGPGLGALLPWSGSREHLPSQGCDRDRGASPCATEQERGMSSSPRRTGGLLDNSPQLMMRFTASPPKFDTSVPLAPPELSEDTLMDDEHNQTMAKLSFILDVVECVVDLARSKGAACQPMADSTAVRWAETLHPAQLPRFSESQKILEQLVLYLRALQMMGQSISLAEHEMKEDRLQYVTSLKNVLHQQNELYMYCIEECRTLYQQLGSLCKTPLTPQLVVNTADKLIYNYAVEQCQAAALDELAGNTKECFQRYTTAQVLLHSLAQLARNDQDKLLLEKYRKSVELRLHNIGSPSMQCPCESYS